MEKKCSYMIGRDGDWPVLLRLEPEEEYKAFILEPSEYSNALWWTYSEEMVDILEHRERFPEYSEISEKEAEEIRQQMQAEQDRKEAELNVITVEHTQKDTENGIVETDVYRKANARRCNFRREDLEKLLSELVKKEDMTILRIDYCFFDEWGYRKYRTAENKEEIHSVCDMPLAIDGYFSDREMNYRFMYLDDDRKVIVAKCRNDSGIDLVAFFDEETNRRAGGFLSV